jgi:hypothetical protein
MTTQKKPLVPGDRVRVYGRPSPGLGVNAWSGRVVTQDPGPHEGGTITVLSDYGQGRFDVHPKQCRRLVKKKPKPAREEARIERWLVNDCPYQCSTTKEEAQKHAAQFGWKDAPKRLVELHPGEVPVSREAVTRLLKDLHFEEGSLGADMILDVLGSAREAKGGGA